MTLVVTWFKAIGLKSVRQQNQRGQMVVEFVLLLVVVVAMATLITNSLVSRDPSSPGLIIGVWNRILEAVASDNAGSPNF